MTKEIPWVNIQDRMPEKDGGFPPLCLVYYTYIGGYNQPVTGTGYDWWDTNKEQWEEHENNEVTHWCYMDDIPAP
ncbi:conserved protein of unknown function [Xenorhabdus poinarii G6]|uniref:DUF551 domain-containing protein n=1 Tax=Xenorhabdus poinarii G6 TaxID=1354304 RepID=A0A068R0U9_9GAMM|nr:DUF551 domain-containing protein [Xenorhabdus poinarii]CDG20546.1 conserved protein of unknown function [Xenorhabdus poinarii G6]